MVASTMNSFHYKDMTPAMAAMQSHPAVAAHMPLPLEAMALKESIMQTHHSKTYAFSLLHLRKMVVPPVQIPRNYKKMRTLKVGGEDVPFTRKQFERQKRAIPRRYRLKTIYEDRERK